MEIYKEINTEASKEFEKLLNNQLSKINIEEGKIIEGKVNKVTEKFVFLYIPGLKSEPILDINELKTMGLSNKAKIGESIPVVIEKLEDKMGEVVVSASKAKKIIGWEKLLKAHDNNELVNGKIISKVKGGCIVEHIETGSLMFLPGSQIDSKPLKDISHLMNVEQKFALIKADRLRGNICCSRREVISNLNKQSKADILKKYKVGDVIENAEVKGFSSFGCFFNANNEIDVLCHLAEISYSRVNHPEEVFNIGDRHSVKVISIDDTKQQIGVSLKAMGPDPWDNVDNYEIGKTYKAVVKKITDFGLFAELEKGLTSLCHNSELSYVKKNISAKKLFKINDEIDFVITNIDKNSRKISLSYKLTKPNPYETLEKNLPAGSITDGEVISKNEYSLFVKLDESECEAFLHCTDLTFMNNGEEELKKYKKGDKIKVKVIEYKIDEQKIKVSHRATKKDPLDFFNDKKVNQTLTVKIISTDQKGLTVRPIGCEMDFVIKRSNIAISSADARSSRYTGGESVDCAIQEIDLTKRKIVLSMRLLEELERDEALKKFGGTDTGKNLPFSSLSEELEKKKK